MRLGLKWFVCANDNVEGDLVVIYAVTALLLDDLYGVF